MSIHKPDNTPEDLVLVTQSRYIKTLVGSLGNGDLRFQLRTLMKACVAMDFSLRYSRLGAILRDKAQNSFLKIPHAAKLWSSI